jgi:hypothetical protein
MQLPLNLHREKRCFLQCKQSQHQPEDNFLEEHITYQLSLFEINETQVKVTIVYSIGNVAIPTLHDKQSPLV